MNILLIADSFGVNGGGFYRYEKIFFQQIMSQESSFQFYICAPEDGKDSLLRMGVPESRLFSWPKGVKSYFKKKRIINSIVHEKNIEVLHYLENIAWYFPKKIKTLVTVHDISPLIYGDGKWMPFFQRWFYKLNLLLVKKKRGIVVTDSEASKKDILPYSNISGEDVKVVPLALDKFQKAKEMPLLLEKNSYILIPATYQERKNLLGMLKVYFQLREKGYKIKLLITGSKNLSSMVFNTLESLRIESPWKEDVFLLQGVSEGELSWLYSNAKLTFYCTFYEAFGFPILESLFFHRPIIVGTFGSTREVGKEYVTYANPLDGSSMLEALEGTLSNSLNGDSFWSEVDNFLERNYSPLSFFKNQERVYKGLF